MRWLALLPQPPHSLFKMRSATARRAVVQRLSAPRQCMGNDTSCTSKAPEISSLSSATRHDSKAPAIISSGSFLQMAKKLQAGGKGSWEFRFFALVLSAELRDDGTGCSALEDALAAAHRVTGVDLTRLSAKSRCGTC